MKSKFLGIYCLAALLIYSFAFSQSDNKIKLSLELGGTRSILKTDISNFIDLKILAKNASAMGASVEYNFYKNFIVSSGLNYYTNSYEYKRTDNRTKHYSTYNNKFINVPLLVGAYLINNPYEKDGFFAKISAGPYYQYLASLKRKGNYPIFIELNTNDKGGVEYGHAYVSENYDFGKNENHLRRHLFGVEGQAELGYSFKEFDIIAKYGYQYGLSRVDKVKSGGKSTINSNIISLGLGYKL